MFKITCIFQASDSKFESGIAHAFLIYLNISLDHIFISISTQIQKKICFKNVKMNFSILYQKTIPELIC